MALTCKKCGNDTFCNRTMPPRKKDKHTEILVRYRRCTYCGQRYRTEETITEELGSGDVHR